MLILSRRAAERIYLGDDIVLTIVAVGADKVRIGVKAPAGVRILRNELDCIDMPESSGQEVTEVVCDTPATLPFQSISSSSEDDAIENITKPSDSDRKGPPASIPMASKSEQTAPRAAGLGDFMRDRKAA